MYPLSPVDNQLDFLNNRSKSPYSNFSASLLPYKHGYCLDMPPKNKNPKAGRGDNKGKNGDRNKNTKEKGQRAQGSKSKKYDFANSSKFAESALELRASVISDGNAEHG